RDRDRVRARLRRARTRTADARRAELRRELHDRVVRPARVARARLHRALCLRDSHPARDARPAEPPGARRVLREVLLVVVLGVVELARGGYLGRDLAVAGLRELALEHLARRLRGLGLRVIERVDRGAVLRPDVVALAHALRRVVVLPEQLEELLVARHL